MAHLHAAVLHRVEHLQSGDNFAGCEELNLKFVVGRFSRRQNAIAYLYESPSGPANVIVTFDERHRPVSTFFESTPLGSHQELMDAAQAIKDCVEYGPKLRGENDKSGATSMLGR